MLNFVIAYSINAASGGSRGRLRGLEIVVYLMFFLINVKLLLAILMKEHNFVFREE